MAYGPLAQCAFMSGPPQFRKKGKMLESDTKDYAALPPFEPPIKCEAPPPGAFTLYAFEPEEMKADPKYTSRMMSLDDLKCVTFGSSQDIDGQVYDGHKSCRKQHAAIYFVKSRCFLKAVNGSCTLESMTLYPKLVDDNSKPVKRYTSQNNRKMEVIEPMDPKQRLTREMCVFKLGDSDRRFFLVGPLPLGDGEVEELAAGEARERKKEKKGKRDDDRRERDDRSRTRSRSREREKKKRR